MRGHPARRRASRSPSGAIDDFRGLRWWEKLGGQLLAASIPTIFGVWVHRFTFPFVGIHAAAGVARDAR